MRSARIGAAAGREPTAFVGQQPAAMEAPSRHRTLDARSVTRGGGHGGGGGGARSDRTRSRKAHASSSRRGRAAGEAAPAGPSRAFEALVDRVEYVEDELDKLGRSLNAVKARTGPARSEPARMR